MSASGMYQDHDDSTEGVRLAHLKRSEPPNEQFRTYVQSTAFSLSLGRTHIRALSALSLAIAQSYGYSEWPISPPAIQALVRRGLVAHDPRPEVLADKWIENYTITTAGKLVLLLLEEAGLVDGRSRRLPPPPPGWVDPRPRITIDLDDRLTVP